MRRLKSEDSYLRFVLKFPVELDHHSMNLMYDLVEAHMARQYQHLLSEQVT